MYSVNLNNGLLDISWDGRVIAEGLSPVVTLESGKELEIGSISENTRVGNVKTGDIWETQYSDKDDIYKLILKLAFHDNLIAGYVDIKSKEVYFWEDADRLAFKGSVQLRLNGMGNLKGAMADYAYCKFWARPHFGTELSSVPQGTQSLLGDTGDDYNYLLPVCSDVCKTELEGSENGLTISVSPFCCGYTEFKTLAFILGTSKNPYQLCSEATALGMNLLDSAGKPREQRRYPEAFEYLGWCTFNAFYGDVNSSGILEKAQEFNDSGLPVKWVLIDGGWSGHVKLQGLQSFKEDSGKFPEGFKHMIKTLKQKHDMRWVGAWQAYTGAIIGIDAEGPLARENQDCLHRTNNNQIMPSIDAERNFIFWHRWNSYLKKQGVDFVKVDFQGTLVEFIKGSSNLSKTAKETHEGLEASVGIDYDGGLINCMGMASEHMWHRQVSAVSRSSDDFYPNKENSFAEHALQNAYNSLLHGQFTWSDYDMWWTIHADSTAHSVLRAVSGGPVYTSDELKHTDNAKLWPLIFSDGKILRCDQPGVPTRDCLTVDPIKQAVPLKIWNKYGNTGIVAAFNINTDRKAAAGAISPSDADGLAGNRFIVREYFSASTRLLSTGEKADMSLEAGGSALYVIVPLNKEGFAPIGLLDKYISPAAISSQQSDSGETNIVLREGGIFGFYCESEPKVFVNGKETAYKKEDILYTVDCSKHGQSVNIRIVEV